MPKIMKIPKSYEWSTKLAYVIGLLVTDGNLSKDGRHIILRSSDVDLLKTFISCLNLKTKISKSFNYGYTRKPSYRVQFSDVQFYRWLNSIGLTAAKTYSIGKIEVPNLYFRDFLRGHLDGDGTIMTYQDKYNRYKGRVYINQRVYTKFISVSQSHIKWLYRKIKELSGVKGSLNSYHNGRSANRVPMWVIKFAKKESIKLLKWIYYKRDLPALQRKMNLAKQLLVIIPNEQRRTYTKIDSRSSDSLSPTAPFISLASKEDGLRG